MSRLGGSVGAKWATHRWTTTGRVYGEHGKAAGEAGGAEWGGRPSTHRLRVGVGAVGQAGELGADGEGLGAQALGDNGGGGSRGGRVACSAPSQGRLGGTAPPPTSGGIVHASIPARAPLRPARKAMHC